MIEFKLNEIIWENLDTEKERHEMSTLIDNILKEADLGKWSGCAVKGHSLKFYCTVKDETLPLETITALAGHKFISFLV